MTDNGKRLLSDGKASFEDLEVFQKAYRVSLDVHLASLRFPDLEQRALAGQVRRASKSIAANIAEGFSRQQRSPAEFRRYIAMAIGSSDEMRVWLRYCRDLGYVDEAKWRQWRDDYHRISKMLTALSKTVGRRIVEHG